MARIVLEYIGSRSSLQTGLIDTTLTDQVNWDDTLPTYSSVLGSASIGQAAPGQGRSDIFSAIGRYTESRGQSLTSTTRNFDITFNGFGFERETIVSNGVTYYVGSQFFTPIIAGTVTSINVNIENRDSVSSSPTGPYGSSSNLKMTITDIAIAPVDLDLRNYQNLFDRVTTGNDQIFGSLASDTIDAGTGNDQVYGYDGNDTIYGGDGNDYLVGENGNDLLFGGNGTDWIIGGAGNDWIVGGEGYDTAKGGDGDDGVVFDAGDNLAEYDGGAGYDILFFTIGEDGSAPTYFSLSGHNFEQANGFRTDTKNQAWATNTNIYDAAWRLVSSEYVNDNGTKDIFRLDPTNAQNWNKIQSRYDVTGKLDYEITFFDDGSSKFLDFDLNNEAVWSSRVMLTNAAGVVTSDTFVLDTALSQRSSEMNQKKVFVSDALI